MVPIGFDGSMEIARCCVRGHFHFLKMRSMKRKQIAKVDLRRIAFFDRLSKGISAWRESQLIGSSVVFIEVAV